MTPDIIAYELTAPDGAALPAWRAGAHLDIVVAPEFLRQYSLCGDPAERGRYRIAVLREDGGRGGSALLQRIFTEGRRVFVGKPVNHFPLVENASKSYLLGGGIGVTPMLAMAHRLYALGADFELHYSVSSRAAAGFVDELAAAPWRERVFWHVSDETTRLDPGALFAVGYRPGEHVYLCGPERYMRAVSDAAAAAGYPDTALHSEYFAVPETPEYVNYPFTLRLARSGIDVAVPADRSGADALADAGIAVDIKCSDGLCGVCRCTVLSGAVEHRDFVLSAAQRKTSMILCQSRAAGDGGVVEIDL